MEALRGHAERDQRLEFIAEPSQASIEHAANLISQVVRSSNLQMALNTGWIALDTCYQGDLGVWRSMRGRMAGLSRLARHPMVVSSASDLSRCIAILDLEDRLAVSVYTSLSVSHFRELLRLPESEQLRFLRLARRKRWPSRTLAAAISAETARPPQVPVAQPSMTRVPLPPRKGPKAHSLLFRNVRRLAGDPNTTFGSVGEAKALSTKEREQTRMWLTDLKAHLEALLVELGVTEQ